VKTGAKELKGLLQELIDARQPVPGRSFGGGLTLSISKAQAQCGEATWALRYRHAGKQREMKLGNYPDMPFERSPKNKIKGALEAARAARVLVDEGRDVAAEKQRERFAAIGAMSFRALAEDYLQRTGKTLVQRSQEEVKRFLKKDLNPRLGYLTARDISSAHVVSLVEEVGKRADSVARRCFSLLSIIFAHGAAKGVIRANPCNGLDLTAILGPRPESKPRIKLTRDELQLALASFTTLGPVLALACKILLATCVRKSELLHAKRTDVDLERGLWQVYAKGGKTYVVPLAPTVVRWFRELIRLAGDTEWILPAQQRRSRFENHHMGRTTLNVALRRLDKGIRDFSPHDLRSTARSYLAELGVDVIVAERCLNHSLGGLVAIYDQHDYLAERREALEKWAKLLSELEGKPDNVVPLRAAA
jgi:integrase